MQAAGVIFLALFALTLATLYIAVRRAWAPTLSLFLAGGVLSMAFVMAYAFTNENVYTAQAVLAGVVVGLGFAGATAAIASFFRSNEPSPRVRLVSSHASQEEEAHNGRDDHAHS
jgi:uncharacterized membrane protein